VGHYQAAETGLLLHLSTVRPLAVITIQCVCMRTEATYIALKRPRPCLSNAVLDSEIAILRRFWELIKGRIDMRDEEKKGGKMKRDKGGALCPGLQLI
jgi:hypothetical protein